MYNEYNPLYSFFFSKKGWIQKKKMKLFFLFGFFLFVFGEESWFTTFHQMTQRNQLSKQNELKQQSKNIKQKMEHTMAQILIELQVLNMNIAKYLNNKATE